MRKLVLSLFALLGVVLGAHGQPERWNYVGNNYSATEHIVYVGLVDEQGRAVSLNTYADWIGAFIDGECRGAAAAAASSQQSGDISYFPLRIKGTEADNGKTVTFRYYRQAGNYSTEYELPATTAFTYSNEQTTGTLSSLFTLSFTQPLYFTFPTTLEVRVGETVSLMDQFTWEPANASRPINIDWNWRGYEAYFTVENDVLKGLAATDDAQLNFDCLREIKSMNDNYSTTIKVLPGLSGFTFDDVLMGRNSFKTITLTPVPADATVDASKVSVRIKNQDLPTSWTLATVEKADATGLQWTITPQAIGYGTVEVYYGDELFGDRVLTIGQSFTQKEGWQWVTPYGGYADLQGIYGDNIQEMRSQTQVMYNDPEYGYFGDLTYMEPTKGYKVRIKDGKSVDGFNMKADYSPVGYEFQVNQKWNWIGFKYQFDHPLADIFADNTGFTSGDRIVSKDLGFAEFDGTAWTGTLTTLLAGEGYMFYNALEDGKVIVPVSEETLGQPSATTRVKANSEPSVWQYNSARFASNMTIVADLGATYASDRYIVGAFIGDECRGEGRFVDGKWFVTVHGDASVKGQVVNFRLYDSMTDKTYAVDETVSFAQMAGSLRQPLRMTVDETTAISSIATTAAGGSVQYTTLDGRRLNGKPAQGVYLVKEGKTVRKLIVK